MQNLRFHTSLIGVNHTTPHKKSKQLPSRPAPAPKIHYEVRNRLGSALLAPLPVPLSSSRLTVRTTISPLLLCKICGWVRMRFEGATLALGSRGAHGQRHQGRCLLLDTLAQDSHVFVFVQYFQVTPPGTLCDCFPLPLHVRFFVMIYTRFTFQFFELPAQPDLQRIFAEPTA